MNIVALNSQIVPTVGGMDGVNSKPWLVIFHAVQTLEQRSPVGSDSNEQPAVMGMAAAATPSPKSGQKSAVCLVVMILPHCYYNKVQWTAEITWWLAREISLKFKSWKAIKYISFTCWYEGQIELEINEYECTFTIPYQGLL